MFLARSCLHAVLVALMTTAMADEKGCDLLGEDDQESAKEKALLKKLEPLTNNDKSYEVTSADEKDQYTYTLKVCRDIFRNMSHAGVVQFDHKSNKTTVVGRISKTHIIGGTSWIMLTYKGGDTYGSHCQQEPRTAIIMIICNRKTLATGFILVGEEREKVSECSYVFQLESSVACLPEDVHLSVGSILLITLASVVAVYIIGGFLYQRLVVGAKGMEQFPHFAFWQDLGNLVADGCDFVCRSKPQNMPAAYRGVGDDQLGEESEERDDHLLPM